MDDANTNKQFRIYDSSERYIRLSVDETIARGLNRWQGWQCSAGKRGLYIDFDGNVWVCNTASSKLYRFNLDAWHKIVKQVESEYPIEQWRTIVPQRNVEFHKTREAFQKILDNTAENKQKYPGFIGNIYQGYDLPRSWFKCPWESCGCGADVILSKAKTSLNKNLLSVTNGGYQGKQQTLNDQVTEISDPVAVEMHFPIPYQILWDLGRKCNYDCSYCWPAVHNRTDEHKPYSVLIDVVDKIISEWSNHEEIRWNFGGGEPTLHPEFLNLLKHLKSKKQWTMVTSNGTRDYKYWSEAVKYLNSINLSAHFDGLHDEEDENRFVRNIESICKHFDEVDDDYWLEVKLMAPPQHFNRALKLRDKIQKLNTLNKPGANNRIKGALSLVPIRSIDDSGKLVDYTEQQLDIFKTQ